MEQHEQTEQEKKVAESEKTNRSNNFTMLAYALGVFIILGISLFVILSRSKAY
jgi:hypothetical protein